MRIVLVTGLLLALAAPLYAESYSWVDDSGGYHFTEDLSRVPKKYRSRVKVRGDLTDEQPAAPAAPDRTGSAAQPAGQAVTFSPSGTPLFGGRTEAAWRSQQAQLEGELQRLEVQLEDLRKQATPPTGIPRERLAELSREYAGVRETYRKKYEEYSRFLDAARQAGLTVDMKK